MKACDKGGQWAGASYLLVDVRQGRLSPSPISVNSVISGCNWENALLQLSYCMEYHPSEVDDICWNAGISAVEKGQPQVAMKLLRSMVHMTFRPDSISYNAVCQTAFSSGFWQNALMLLEEMIFKYLKPTVITYNTCMSCCAAAGRWIQASALFLGLCRRSSLQPSTISKGALLAAQTWQRALCVLRCFKTGDGDCGDQWNDFVWCFFENKKGILRGVKRTRMLNAFFFRCFGSCHWWTEFVSEPVSSFVKRSARIHFSELPLAALALWRFGLATSKDAMFRPLWWLQVWCRQLPKIPSGFVLVNIWSNWDMMPYGRTWSQWVPLWNHGPSSMHGKGLSGCCVLTMVGPASS